MVLSQTPPASALVVLGGGSQAAGREQERSRGWLTDHLPVKRPWGEHLRVLGPSLENHALPSRCCTESTVLFREAFVLTPSI